MPHPFRGVHYFGERSFFFHLPKPLQGANQVFSIDHREHLHGVLQEAKDDPKVPGAESEERRAKSPENLDAGFTTRERIRFQHVQLGQDLEAQSRFKRFEIFLGSLE
jgi:hypothetical protein